MSEFATCILQTEIDILDSIKIASSSICEHCGVAGDWAHMLLKQQRFTMKSRGRDLVRAFTCMTAVRKDIGLKKPATQSDLEKHGERA